MHEVTLRFKVKGSDDRQEAVEMAASYFGSGDFYQQVTQMEPEVMELPDVQEPEATEA